MQFTVDLPDDIAQRNDPGRQALEKLVLDGYMAERMTAFEGAQLLGMGRIEFLDFLGSHNVGSYSLEKLRNDVEHAKEMAQQKTLGR